MCLINAAHEHFLTEIGKKLEAALKNFTGPGGRGAEGPRALYKIELEGSWFSSALGPHFKKIKLNKSFRLL